MHSLLQSCIYTPSLTSNHWPIPEDADLYWSVALSSSSSPTFQLLRLLMLVLGLCLAGWLVGYAMTNALLSSPCLPLSSCSCHSDTPGLRVSFRLIGWLAGLGRLGLAQHPLLCPVHIYQWKATELIRTGSVFYSEKTCSSPRLIEHNYSRSRTKLVLFLIAICQTSCTRRRPHFAWIHTLLLLLLLLLLHTTVSIDDINFHH